MQLDPQSPRASLAAELAREMLTARVAGDNELLNASLNRAVQAVSEDTTLGWYLMVAQNFLCWAAICQAIGPDVSEEAFIQSLALAMESHGWTFG